MQESQQEELEELLATRLIKQVEAEDFIDVKHAAENGEQEVGEGLVEFAKPRKVEIASDESAHVHDISTTAEGLPATFTKVEKSLASLGFFTPSSRRLKGTIVKRISFTREHEGKRIDVSAEIIPSAMFGLPITADQDKYLALQEIITHQLQTEGVVTNPIRFRSADLLRLMNRNAKSGTNYKEIGEWLDVMSSTMIKSTGIVYKADQKRFVTDRFHVFDRAVSVGKELEDGSLADANYVWLSEWQLNNINNNFLLPIDLATYRELKNHIAKALVPLLQIWLFASQKAGSFEKRYDELCEILNLQTYRTPSQITRQLKSSLDELARYEYLEKWQIERTSDRKAYKIVFFHGSKFHRDRRRRLDQKNKTQNAVIVAQSEPFEPKLPEPGKLEPSRKPVAIPLPVEPIESTVTVPAPLAAPASSSDTISPRSHASIDQHEEADLESQLVDQLSARGLMPSSAMKLLRLIPEDRLGQVEDFIDYWDDIKRTKEVGQGFLYTLIKEGNPLPASFETRAKRRERLLAEDRRQKLLVVKDALKSEYDEHCRQVIDRFIAGELPAGEFERRVVARKNELSKQGGLWETNTRPEFMDTMARHAVRAEIAKSISVIAYDDFYPRRLPALLAELELDAAALGIELPPTEPHSDSASA
ncbi:MAG: replication initiator protein A [Nitrospiraceae bacterium]|nr:replication initiator protein A [Nitrospiraceae bacterium]